MGKSKRIIQKNKVFSVTDYVRMFNMDAAWYFISIPLEDVPDAPRRGWNSVPVMATIGDTTWRTSLFPMKKDHYFIPLKKAVRMKEGIEESDWVTVTYRVASV